MSYRRISMTAAVFLVLLTTLAASCPCTKEDCKSRHGLVEPTPEPLPGPIIILHPDGGTNVWSVGSTTQSTDGPANGVLRDDFIGQSILTFDIKYEAGGGGSGLLQNVDELTLGNASNTLELDRSSQNTAIWKLNNVTLNPSGNMSTGDVPSGFANLSYVSSDPPLPGGATFQQLTFRVTMK